MSEWTEERTGEKKKHATVRWSLQCWTGCKVYHTQLEEEHGHVEKWMVLAFKWWSVGSTSKSMYRSINRCCTGGTSNMSCYCSYIITCWCNNRSMSNQCNLFITRIWMITLFTSHRWKLFLLLLVAASVVLFCPTTIHWDYTPYCCKVHPSTAKQIEKKRD